MGNDSLLIVVFSLLFSAFFSGIEIAFISANRLKVEVDKNKGEFGGAFYSKLIYYRYVIR